MEKNRRNNRIGLDPQILHYDSYLKTVNNKQWKTNPEMPREAVIMSWNMPNCPNQVNYYGDLKPFQIF